MKMDNKTIKEDLLSLISERIDKMVLPTVTVLDPDFILVYGGKYSEFVYQDIIVPCLRENHPKIFSMEKFIEKFKHSGEIKNA